MEEIWKSVFVNGVYTGKLVSNTGRLIREEDGYECVLADNGAGYLTYQLLTYRNAEGQWQSKREYAHRLVAKHFLPNPDNLPQVNHKDCNKWNNHVDNLEWSTRKANIDHAHAMGRMKNRTENAEINILEVNQVIELYVSVKRDNRGISEMARELGFPRTTASSIMNKRSRGVITDRIDSYLSGDDFLISGMPSIYDLGFNSKTKLVRVHTELSANSTSGATGIVRSRTDGIEYWTAQWKDGGKQRSKYFNITKYGDEVAFQMACEHRTKMIEEIEKEAA
jgi:hypothetical protein